MESQEVSFLVFLYLLFSPQTVNNVTTKAWKKTSKYHTYIYKYAYSEAVINFEFSLIELIINHTVHAF